MSDQNGKWFQYVVVGCGGIGSAAVYWLAKRAGSSVLGLEQFELGHDHGGSQDHSRIIRLVYSEAMYTKLAGGAFDCWDEVEKESGLQLVYKTGGVMFSRRGGIGEKIVEQYANALDVNGVRYEQLNGLDLHARFPQFTASDNYRAIYQKDSGIVDAALGNAVHIQLARKHGATVLDNTKVERIKKIKDGSYEILTNRGTFCCQRVAIAAGAWANSILSSVGVQLPLTVTQEQVMYFATPHIKEFTKSRFPIWIHFSDGQDLYGLPIHGNSGVKIGVDVGGESVTTETRTYTPSQKLVKQCIDFSREHIPRSLGPILRVKTCLYTLTPDRHFVIDTCHRTNFEDVVVCCGAGHGYKFASVFGRILSELCIDGRTDFDISPFTLGRDALTNPSFKPRFQMGTANLEASKL